MHFTVSYLTLFVGYITAIYQHRKIFGLLLAIFTVVYASSSIFPSLKESHKKTEVFHHRIPWKERERSPKRDILQMVGQFAFLKSALSGMIV